MIKTPIHSFLLEYKASRSVRLHMPGHKGVGDGAQMMDITEIPGADSLFEANGIIEESERIAGEIFGADTFYSTEGSSLSIRAMLYLTALYAKRTGKAPLIAAARNVHKSFISAAALVDFGIDWISSEQSSYLSAMITPDDVKAYLYSAAELPVALYLTSPDYLGYVSDIKEIADICHKNGILLIIDNAHGAYLKFLTPSSHPIDLGADMCCDSAHKTLSALTGCAYMHISKSAPPFFKENAKKALMLFASTSPSYLILDSLDRLNPCLSQDFSRDLQIFVDKIKLLKDRLSQLGFTFAGNEPMKITIRAKHFGYLGTDMSAYLLEEGIVSEFADSDYLVLMPSPRNTDAELKRLFDALSSLKRKKSISSLPPAAHLPERKISIRDAIIADFEILPVSHCKGRVASSVTLGCPPAIPIAAPGEIVDEKIILAFEYYGIYECAVVK